MEGSMEKARFTDCSINRYFSIGEGEKRKRGGEVIRVQTNWF